MNSLPRFGISIFAGLALVSSAFGVGLNQVTYTPNIYPVEGTIPYTRSVAVGMEIQRGVAPFNPVALPVPVTVSIVPTTDASGNIVGVSVPEGASIATALSYLQLNPLPQVTFTATNTKVFVTIQVTVPADAVGGAYGYTLKTTGWPAGMSGGVPTDAGFSINASVTVPTNPNPPTVAIQSPTANPVFTYAPAAMPASIPLSFTADSTGSSAIYGISADVDGVSTFMASLNGSGLPVITATDLAPIVTGFNTTSVGVTTNMTVSTGGAHSANVTATNSVGSNQPAQSAPFTVYVTPIAPSATVPAFVVGQPVSFQIAISPLTYPAATYSIGSGSLPAGVTLDPTTGIVSGTPLSVGSADPVVITATNYVPGSTTAIVGSASQSYTIPVSKGTPSITWSDPAAITYGTPLSATQLNATASITGGTFVYTPALAAILPVGTNTLSVTFNPTDSTNYNSVTKTVSIVVNRKPLAVVATVADKEYDGSSAAAFTATGYPKVAGVVGTDEVGLALGATAAFSNKVVGTGKTVTASGLVLTGASIGNYSVPSSVTTTANITAKRLTVSGVTANDRDYNGTTGATLNMSAAQLVGVIPNDNVLLAGTGTGLFADKNAGSNKAVTVSALSLSGNDAENYLLIQPSGVTASIRQVPLSITAIDQIINYGVTPSAPSYTYASFVNGETATTAGVFLTPVTYTAAPTIGTPVQAGTYVITPGGATATNYSITFKPGTLTVHKVTPTVTWATPSAITQGTALSGTQLNASSAVAGTFVYTPASGTVLPVGTQTLNVSFSPTDTANYTGPVAASVLLTVNAVNTLTCGTAIVRHAPKMDGNAGVDGSLQVLLPESMALNGQAFVSEKLLVVGTPGLNLNGKKDEHPVVGSQTLGAGAVAPSNYTITLNGNAVIGTLVRHTDAVTMPPVAVPPSSTGTRDVKLNKASDSAGNFATVRDLTVNGNMDPVAVPFGTYRDISVTGNTGLILGVAGATTPSTYNVRSLKFTGNSTLKVVGPVVINVANDVSFNADAGDSAHADWLTLNLATGGLTLNGVLSFYGYVLAPNGEVKIDGQGKLSGGLKCDRLTLNGWGLVDLCNNKGQSGDEDDDDGEDDEHDGSDCPDGSKS